MTRAPYAALFPGQGSQAVGMAQALYEASPAAKAALDVAEAALPGLLELMWSGPAEELQKTANQQPALVAAGAAAYAAWLETGAAPATYVAGHSLGEFTALVAAGALDLGDAVRLVRARGEAMQRAVPESEGAMAAILKVDAAAVVAAVEAVRAEGLVVDVANYNAPQQTVVSGRPDGVAAASARLKEAGARAIPLKVSAPFHCRLMAPAAADLQPRLAAVALRPLQAGLVANVTADLVADVELERRLLVEQVTAPVRWTDSLRRLADLGVARFVEFGSGQVLTGLVGRTLEGAAAVAVVDPASLKEALA
ncbi:MAG: ACP S-malonyltransferase [Trueperaceae bacterium]|nr:ACP S-malonyltransferase [Trueperaceae bacterium]